MDCGTSVELQVVTVVLDEHSVMKVEVDALTKVFISNCENACCDNPSKLLCMSSMSCNVTRVLR